MTIEIIGYVVSVFMGLSLGLVGGGGSILTVPILVYFFSFDPLLATSSSLIVVGLTALLGAIVAFKNKNVYFISEINLNKLQPIYI